MCVFGPLQSGSRACYGCGYGGCFTLCANGASPLKDREVIAPLAACGVDTARLTALLAELPAQVPCDLLYIYQTSGGIGGGGGQRRNARTLLAFETPDAAILFAQRNGLNDDDAPPRLRQLVLTWLLLAMVWDPGISTLLIVCDGDECAPGHMPEGVHVERGAMF